MRIKEITQALNSLGWRTKMSTGERLAHFYLPDRTIRIIYGIKPLPGEQQFVSTLSLTTNLFSDVWAKIDPSDNDDGYWPLVSAWKGLDIRAPEILAEHVKQGSDEAIAWAKAQDLDQALRDCAALPTTRYGTSSLKLLAALAILGDVDKLKFYQSRLEAGDRLGFVPYITRDHIDRAVTLAAPFAARTRPDTETP